MVLGVVHYDEAWTEILLNSVVVVELGLLETNCAMLYIVSTVGRDRIDSLVTLFIIVIFTFLGGIVPARSPKN